METREAFKLCVCVGSAPRAKRTHNAGRWAGFFFGVAGNKFHRPSVASPRNQRSPGREIEVGAHSRRLILGLRLLSVKISLYEVT